MTSLKRKMPTLGLQRRVRARVEPEPESEIEENSADEAPSEEGFESEGPEDDIDANDADLAGGSDYASDQSSSSEDEDGSETPALDASQLSFGALAKAQASMPSLRKQRGDRDRDAGDASSDRLASVREEMAAARNAARTLARAHKHAPQEMTSKRQVSRRREVIATPGAARPVARDPRFDPVVAGGSARGSRNALRDDDRAARDYAFLDEYRESEMRQLREAAAKAGKKNDPEERERLQRALRSMQSRKEAGARKAREREVLAEQRRKEKELVAQGKKPFFLKRSEQKKAVLTDRFSSLGKKQVDKVIERKRKKVAAKEKKALPLMRRGIE